MKLSSGQRTAAYAALIGAGAALSTAALFMVVGAFSGSRLVVVPATAASALFFSLALPCVSIFFAARDALADWLKAWTPVLAGSAVAMGFVSMASRRPLSGPPVKR